MMNKISLFGIFLCFIFGNVFPQSANSKYRMGIKASNSITNKFSISVELQERMQNYRPLHDRVNFETNLHYKLNSLFRYSIGYRLSSDYSFDEGTKNLHRLHTDIRFKNTIQRWEYKVRTRLQLNNPRVNMQDIRREYFNRTELTWTYNIYKFPLTPLAAIEYHYNLQPSDENAFDKLRYSLGAHYRMNQKIELSLLYMFDKELNKSFNAHIIECMCAIELN